MTHHSSPTPQSLADVSRTIHTLKKIRPSSRKEMLSAISRLGKLLGRPLHDIPADLETLRGRIQKLHSVHAKVSKKSLSNIKAGLILALRFAGVADELYVAIRESEQWATFRHSGTSPHQAYALSQFARYCSAQDIEPADVTEKVMDRYEAHLACATINCDPKRTRIETAKTFNCIVKRTGSNRPLLNASKGSAYVTPPLDIYPESLQKEIEAYLGRIADPNIFSEDDLAKPLRPHSVRNIKHHLRQALDAAVIGGYERAYFTRLERLIDINVIERAFTVIIARLDGKVTATLLNILATLVAIARHEVKVPDADLRRLLKLQTRIRQKLDGHGDGMSAKSERRVAQFDDSENVRRFVLLPYLIAKRVRGSEPTTELTREMMYAAAMILLLGQPMRAGNLASIELGKHLTPIRRGRKISYRLLIPAEEVKNRLEVLVDYTDAEADILYLYISKHRILLSEEPGPYLFPARSGGARAPKHLSEGLKRIIFKYTGLEVSAHIYRHFAAKIYLEAHPGDYESTRRLVGHRKLETTTSFYAPRSSRAAQKRYEAILASKRGGKT